MRADREYQIYLALSSYLKQKFPTVLFHFDYAGNHMTKVQAGKMKAIQGKRGFCDLQLLEPRKQYSGLFIEIKAEGTRLFKRNGEYATEHLAEQAAFISALNQRGYYAGFGIGTTECINMIDSYLL